MMPAEGETVPPEPQGRALIKGEVKSTLTSEYSKFLMGEFAAGVILIIAVTAKENFDQVLTNWEYAIVAGSVGAVLACVGLFLLSSTRGEYHLFNAPMLGEINVTTLLALFLLLWWGVAVTVLTFQRPFNVTGNGYFATWAGGLSALGGIGSTLPKLKESARAAFGFLLGLLVCALTVGFELAVGDINISQNAMGVILGLIVSVLAFFVVMNLILLDIYGSPAEANVRRALLVTVFILWGGTAAWLTFTGPFVVTGNGYFGLWIGLYCASKLVLDAQTKISAMLDNESVAAMWGQFVAGCVIILATLGLETTGPPGSQASETVRYWGYALSVGIVAAVFSFCGAVLLNGPTGNKTLFTTSRGPVTINGLIAIFLFLWWGVGTPILTIRDPFTLTKNGFFAAWFGFLCSVVGIGLSSSKMKGAASSTYAPQGCLGMSAAMLIAILSPKMADETAEFKEYEGPIVYTMVISYLTIAWVFVNVFMMQKGMTCGLMLDKVQSVARLALWIISAGWTTFRGPFLNTENGYIAVWAGATCSALLLVAVWMPVPPKPEGDQVDSADGASKDEESLGGGNITTESYSSSPTMVNASMAPEDSRD